MTIYNLSQAKYSIRGHKAAQRFLYPEIFKVPFDWLTFETTTLSSNHPQHNIYDGKLGIDHLVKIQDPNDTKSRGPIVFSIQERHRSPSYVGKQDLTITEWNLDTNESSELHKIQADIFLYTYFGEWKGNSDGRYYTTKEKEEKSKKDKTLIFVREENFLDAIAVWAGPLKLLYFIDPGLFDRNYDEDKDQTFVAIKFRYLAMQKRQHLILYWKRLEEQQRKDEGYLF